jgi:hypothetical protein
MTVSASFTPAPERTVTFPSRGVASRLVATGLHVTTGLVLAATVLGLSVANAIIARGNVVADPGDVAMLRALAPVGIFFVLVAAGHVAAGLGIVFGSRTAAALGIGLGAFDAVAGITALVISGATPSNQFDGIGLGATFVVMGIVLAVAARAADWNTNGEPEEDEEA